MGMMRQFKKQEQRSTTPEDPYQGDMLGMAVKSGKVDDPVGFVKTLKKDLDNTKFNNTPESHLQRILDRKCNYQNFDVYNLNQLFGLPSD